MIRSTFLLICLSGLASLARAELPVPAEHPPAADEEEAAADNEVVVTSTRVGEQRGLWRERVQVIDRRDLEAWSGTGLNDLLILLTGLDVQRRGPAQADLAFSGAGFEQLLVIVDGVPLNDPQTGHHNLDLPLTADDIERIEIAAGAGSAVHGPGAVGGVIQVITRSGLKGGSLIRASAGTFARLAGSTSLVGRSLPAGGQWGIAGRTSVGVDESDGHRAGTEARVLVATQGAALVHPGGLTRLRVAYRDSRFGADGFYGPWPSTERTGSLLAMVQSRLGEAKGIEILPRLSFRRHTDHFVLDRHQTELYQAEHESRVLGGEIGLRAHDTVLGELAFGLEGAWQNLESSSLGDHRRLRAGVYLEQADSLFGFLHWSLGARLDMVEDEDGTKQSFFSPRLVVRTDLGADWSLTASAGRGFRLPSFTELYYDSPANQGDPDLRVERTWAADLALSYRPTDEIDLRLSGFVRFDSNLVDWNKASEVEAWQATQTGEILAGGARFEVGIRPWRSFAARVGYARLHLQRDPPEGLSKYVFRQVVDDAWLRLVVRLPWEFQLMGAARYRRRPDSVGDPLIDLRLQRTFGILRVYLHAANLLDRRVEEIPGAPLAGFSMQAGLAVGFDQRD